MGSNKLRRLLAVNKLIVLGAAFILASLIGSTPAAAVTPQCDPLVIAADPNGDCDGDGVFDDACPYTVLGEDLVVGTCTIPGLDFIYPEGSGPAAGCSLTELLDNGIDNCAAGAKNHGKYVSCVSHLTNFYKKQKLLTGAQKGLIQSCAAQTDIGKKPHP